jgi:acyl-CoA thioesterase
MAVTFDDAIRLTRTDPDTYVCSVSPDYWLTIGPNGGYLAALLAHAGDTHLGDQHRQLRGLTVHYLRPPVADQARIVVTTEQMGRSVAFQRIEMHQGGKLTLLATGSWADGREGIEHSAWEPPNVPALWALI